jgi:BASS family bile acid:Na+ symporter
LTVDRLINVLVTTTLIEMMFTIGLSVTVKDLIAIAGDWRVTLRGLVGNYVCVPAITVILLIAFDARPMIAAGFVILAACPGAPYGPPLTGLGKGDVSLAVGLMIILAGSSAIVTPILLHFMLPFVCASESLNIQATKIVVTLLITQLLPLSAGIAVRQWTSSIANRLHAPANLTSKLLNVLTVALIVVTQFHLFSDIRLKAFVGMLALLIASWVAGWLLGGPGMAKRKAMMLTTSLRNIGVGLVIATGAFPATPAVTVALVYGLFGVVGSLLLAFMWARFWSANNAVEGQTE